MRMFANGERPRPRRREAAIGLRRQGGLGSAGTLTGIAVAIAYGAGLWLEVLHGVAGSTPREPSPWLAWLRHSTLALPLVVAAVAVAARYQRRLFGRLAVASPRRLVVAAWAAGLAAAGSTALAAATLAGERLFGGGSGPVLSVLSSSAHLSRDALSGLPVALALAVALTAWGARPRRAPERLPEARGARTALHWRARAVVAGGLALAITGPAVAAPLPTTATSVPTSTDPGNPCPVDRSLDASPFHKTFFIEAIKVNIPLNNYGDYDPEGKMYVAGRTQAELTAQLAGVRAQESDPLHRVTPGLRDDPIQAMVIRANQGDCVDVTFTNQVGDGNAYGFHVDGVSFKPGSSGDAVGFNPASDSRSGAPQHYRYWLPYDETLEGGHYAHPGPAFRDAVSHGLFGVMVVEPPGSIFLDPDRTPEEQAQNKAFPTREQVSGQQAMVVPCVTDTAAQYCARYSKGHASHRSPQPFRDGPQRGCPAFALRASWAPSGHRDDTIPPR